MISAHLPALQIIVPLISAPLCAILPSGRIAWLFATMVSWLALAMAAMLLIEVTANGPIDYEMGGWAAPWGIALYVDRLGALVLVIVTGIGALAEVDGHQVAIGNQGVDHRFALDPEPKYIALTLGQ